MARIRSPNYPQLSLPAAVERVSKVFDKEHQHPAPKEVIAQHLGYSGINGASLGAISALLKYGLLEKVGEDLKVSDNVLSILHPSSDAEKREALKSAATAPALFNELIDHFGDRLPSDNNLQSYLIRRGFGPNVLTNVIGTFRETMDYVDVISEPPAQAPAQQREYTTPPAQASHQAAPPSTRGASVSVTLENDQLRVTAVLVDQKGIVKLIQVLEANKLLLPAIVDKSAPKEVQEAITHDSAE